MGNAVIPQKKGENVLQVSVDYKVIKNNCSAIKRDIDYFNKMANENLCETEKNSFSRVVIVYCSFYLVSLSDYLKNNYTINQPTRYPTGIDSKPIKIFYAFAQTYDSSKNLALLGVQDLYTVRNKIFAHTLGTTTADSSVPSSIQQYNFRKLTRLPNNFSDYSYEEKEILLDEFNNFMKDFFPKYKKFLKEDDYHLFNCVV